MKVLICVRISGIPLENWGITYLSVIINTLGKVVKSCLYTNNLVSNTYPLMYIYVHLSKCIFDSIVMKKGFGNKHSINENISMWQLPAREIWPHILLGGKATHQ